jgi:hypothetical protein
MALNSDYGNPDGYGNFIPYSPYGESRGGRIGGIYETSSKVLPPYFMVFIELNFISLKSTCFFPVTPASAWRLFSYTFLRKGLISALSIISPCEVKNDLRGGLFRRTWAR